MVIVATGFNISGLRMVFINLKIRTTSLGLNSPAKNLTLRIPNKLNILIEYYDRILMLDVIGLDKYLTDKFDLGSNKNMLLG